VQVWLDQIDEQEMRELVVDAWRMVVPKKVAAEWTARAGPDEAGAATSTAGEH
jgi:hypothetical protein